MQFWFAKINIKHFDFWLIGSHSKLESLYTFQSKNNHFLILRKLFWNYSCNGGCNCIPGFEVLNPTIKLFWLLIEWKFSKLESHCILHSGIKILLGGFLNFYGMYLNTWNMVIFYNINMLYPNIKSFWLLV